MRTFLHSTVFTLFFVLVFAGFQPYFFFLFAQETDLPKEQEQEVLEPREADRLERSLLRELEVSQDVELLSWAQRLGFNASTVQEAKEFLFRHFALANLQVSSSKNPSERLDYEIRIQNAEELGTFEVASSPDGYLRFWGSVHIEVSSKNGNGTRHRIKASEVLFNSDKNLLIAQGQIEYTQLSSQQRIFLAEYFLLDLNAQQAYLETTLGQEEGRESSQSYTVNFYGEKLYKTYEEALFIKQGAVSTSRFPFPYYSLRASRIWITPHGGWAVWDAVFYLGEIPILYLPFYIHTSDEIFFHPVFSFDALRGASIQTTFYLYGQKIGQSHNQQAGVFSSLSFFSDFEKQRVRENLYLIPSEEQRQHDDYLKFFFDSYSQLGIHLGTEASFRELFPFYLNFYIGLGFSRALYWHPDNLFFTFPFDDFRYQGAYQDSFLIPGVKVPFRYAFEMDSDWSWDALRLRIFLQHYSDPFFRGHFMQYRMESFDVLTLIMGQAYQEMDEMNSTLWILDGSYQKKFFDLPEVDLSIDLDTMGLVFEAEGNGYFYDDPPTDSFFSPDILYFPAVGLTLQGQLFSWTWQRMPLKAQEVQSTSGDQSEDSDGQEVLSEESSDPLEKNSSLSPFPLEGSFHDGSGEWMRFSHWAELKGTYLYDPYWRYVSYFQEWTRPEDIDYSFKSFSFEQDQDFSFDFTLSILDNFFLLKWQPYFYWSLLDYHNKLEPALEPLYKEDDWTFGEKIQIRNNFFNTIPSLSSSYWNYQLSHYWYTKAYNYDYQQDMGSYQTSWNEFTDSQVPLHDISFYLNWNQNFLGTSQHFYFRLPPKTQRSESKSSIFFQKWLWKSSGDLVFIREDLYQTKQDEFRFTNTVLDDESSFEIRHSLVYDLIQRDWDRIDLSLRWSYLTLAFEWKWMQANHFDQELSTWIQEEQENLHPYLMQIFYRGNLFSWKDSPREENAYWEIYFNLDAGWNIYWQLITDTFFWFGFEWKLSINRFTELKFNTYSENTQSFRYIPGFVNTLGLDSSQNISFWQDLFNSLNFWDQETRFDALFKLKRYSWSWRQIFPDWFAEANLALSPRLKYADDFSSQLQWDQTFTFYISWTPFSMIKTKLMQEEGLWTWDENPLSQR